MRTLCVQPHRDSLIGAVLLNATGSGYNCGTYAECGGEAEQVSDWLTSPSFLVVAGLGCAGLSICVGLTAMRWWRQRPGRELPYPTAEPAGSDLSEVLQPSY